MRLVVNIPTYNEKENIEEIIKLVLSQQKKIPKIDLHVLISDSHSPDGTGDIVKKITRTNPKVHYLDVKERGLGIGIVKGHRFAIDRLKADVLAQMDGDLSHDPSTLPQMIKQIDEGYDLIIGSRLMKGGKNLLGLHRRIFTLGASLVCRIAWGHFELTEFTNSYRVFTKKLFQRIDFSKVPWRSQTYIIQPSFLYAAMEAGAKIKELPITFEDRKKGYSKSKIYHYIIDVLFFSAKVRLQKSKIFIKFLMVGTISYLINAIVLGLLYRGAIYGAQVMDGPILDFVPTIDNAPKFSLVTFDRLLVASVISIELSIIFNFIMHDNWTFKGRSHDGSRLLRFLKFNLTSIGSPIIQLATILAVVRVFDLHEQVGLAIGVIIGLFFNYFVNLLWVWKEKSPEQTPIAQPASSKVK